MTYTAENVANIKRAGNLDAYIAHERQFIETLENAEIRYNTHGDRTVSYGHLYGRYGFDDETAEVVAYKGWGDWEDRRPVASFDGDGNRALAYARTALENHLTELGKEVLEEARLRLIALEAAQ
ncbi:hypothetical protein [Brucella sp. IR073]|uniref:hypothetical protein n=1 Tax=unclassified Brucella TaxID=2632610 RepID=UPI003B97E116